MDKLAANLRLRRAGGIVGCGSVLVYVARRLNTGHGHALRLFSLVRLEANLRVRTLEAIYWQMQKHAHKEDVNKQLATLLSLHCYARGGSEAPYNVTISAESRLYALSITTIS